MTQQVAITNPGQRSPTGLSPDEVDIRNFNGTPIPTLGPLSILDSSQYDFTDLSYPIDVGKDPQKGHFMIFYIQVQSGSQYQNQTGGGVNAGENATAVQNLMGDPGDTQQIFAFGNQATTALGNKIGLGNSGLSLLPQTSRAKGAICLYMPDTVYYADNLGYDEPSLTDTFGMTGLAAQTGIGAVKSFIDGLKTGGWNGKAENAWGPIAEFTGDKTFGGDTAGIALAAAGLAVNPQLQVIFKGVGLRQFQFVFTFAPTSSAEADAAKSIIQTFRFHAAPEIAPQSSGRYFIPPSLFDIEYHRTDGENSNIPKISTCVLESINTDFAAGGVWSAFTDGKPTITQLTLNFREIEIITKARIKSGY